MKLGIIGIGNMGNSLLKGVIDANIIPKEDIIASAKSQKTINKAKSDYNISTTLDNIKVVERSDIIVLAVKPNIIQTVCQEIKRCITQDKVLVSLAVGTPISKIQSFFNRKINVVRAMPNTPISVKEGMISLVFGENIDEDKKIAIKKIFESVGKVAEIDENLMDTASAIAASSPAFVFIFIEALADAAVLGGMKREDAYNYASQAILGSAKLYLDTKIHPAKLKDDVCSPAGTTIEAIASLEKNGFRHSIIEAVEKCIKKSKNM